MKKTTKGAIAAGGAAVLLMGGAGTLAYWTSTATVAGTSISTGHMSLDLVSCGGWKLDDGTALASQKLVPGDSISNVCTYTLSASGSHLAATLTTPAAVAATGTLASAANVSLPVTSAYSLGGTALSTSAPATVTSADNGKTLSATITVSFPYGTADSTPSSTDGTNGNATQDKAASLNDITVSLVQNSH
ncbi:alternate-type signal peptide domain-containing protein [Nocardioides ultimimeridianus]